VHGPRAASAGVCGDGRTGALAIGLPALFSGVSDGSAGAGKTILPPAERLPVKGTTIRAARSP
jgi:hypothetical protein